MGHSAIRLSEPLEQDERYGIGASAWRALNRMNHPKTTWPTKETLNKCYEHAQLREAAQRDARHIM